MYIFKVSKWISITDVKHYRIQVEAVHITLTGD